MLSDEFLAPGYGQLNQGTRNAIEQAARREGLLLDPVYTGKAMAAFLARARALPDASKALFIHTGGSPSIFAYGPALTED